MASFDLEIVSDAFCAFVAQGEKILLQQYRKIGRRVSSFSAPFNTERLIEFSATTSEGIPKCKLDCAAIEIRYGNWGQSLDCI
jgi:hypothetical protein